MLAIVTLEAGSEQSAPATHHTDIFDLLIRASPEPPETQGVRQIR
jgi:hypothetical protein